ncbi:MAG: twin-arginine translocation signal domain-containing protein [Alphaproteobacteria bacterium]|nr:twin-arginine translocation signal domain-containing protein [Alphaproteobacteria bacterium]
MNMNRRDFIKLLGMAVAAPAVGMSSDLTIDGLSPELAKKIKSCKMDDADKKILQNMIAAGKTEQQFEMFSACLSSSPWSKIDKRIKENIADMIKDSRTFFLGTPSRNLFTVQTPGMQLNLLHTSAYCNPKSINQANVYGWFERSERISDYIALPDVVSKQLSPEEREWAESLLFVVNDNLHPLLTAPYAVPTRAEFMNGDANGRMMCSVGGIFPERCDKSGISKKEVAEWWKSGKKALNSLLQKRDIPEKMWETYHKVGYVYVLSELDGEDVAVAGTGGCTEQIFYPNTGKVGDFIGIRGDVFTNAFTPIPGAAQGCLKDFEPALKGRRREAKGNLMATLSGLSKEKGLSMRQKRVFDTILSQLSRVQESQRPMTMATRQKTMLLDANSTHTRGRNE